MNGKTHTIRRRLSAIALTASLAAIAIPAANASGVLGPGLKTVEKQGPYGGYWIRKHEAARVLGPGLNTVEKRGPYGAYWVSKTAQFTPSIVDDWFRDAGVKQSITPSVGSQNNEPSMDEVHLYPRRSAEDVFAPTAAIDAASANWAAKAKLLDVNGQLRRDILKSAALEHGSNGFLGQTKNQHQVNIRLPRADDPMFREIVQEAAQEHGATGFGNGLDLSIGLGLIRPVQVTAVRDAGDARGSKLSLSSKPASVDYSHLPQEDRFGV